VILYVLLQQLVEGVAAQVIGRGDGKRLPLLVRSGRPIFFELGDDWAWIFPSGMADHAATGLPGHRIWSAPGEDARLGFHFSR
jgi:hypothetical protein